MPKPYSKLRARIAEKELDCQQVAKLSGINDPGAFSRRMTNQMEWRLSEAYKILDILEIPHSELYLYFPQGGKTVKEGA